MATILSTSKDAPPFSFLGHSHGWQMTISSGLKVHGQWKPLVDVNIWNMISLFGKKGEIH